DTIYCYDCIYDNCQHLDDTKLIFCGPGDIEYPIDTTTIETIATTSATATTTTIILPKIISTNNMTKVTTNNVVPITENPPTNDLKYQLHRKKRSQIDLDKHEAFNVQYACYSVEYESQNARRVQKGCVSIQPDEYECVAVKAQMDLTISDELVEACTVCHTAKLNVVPTYCLTPICYQCNSTDPDCVKNVTSIKAKICSYSEDDRCFTKIESFNLTGVHIYLIGKCYQCDSSNSKCIEDPASLSKECTDESIDRCFTKIGYAWRFKDFLAIWEFQGTEWINKFSNSEK
uniref:Uncharacterized protein n=1 Tax=Glossina morsitans morsitans TaxID=37546 RepID=A0A1B0FRE8_GLOMM